MSKKTLKTESELQHLLEETRRMKRQILIPYKPDRKVVIHGTEILNYTRSGFPNLKDLLRVLDYVYNKAGLRPLAVVSETSIRYLFESRKEVENYLTYVSNGYQLGKLKVKFIESDKKTLLLDLALSENAKIVSNQNILESLDLTAGDTKYQRFKGQSWQLKYKLTETEIKLFVTK